jgi:beta-glucanase (GH16 family)
MYKTTLLAVLLLTALTSCSKDDNAVTKPDENTVTPTPDPKIEAPAGYTLVWSDEFDVDGLPDPKKWDYDTEANKTGWYNNEKQYYAKARLENSKVENGKLIITARKEKLSSMSDYGGQSYSSARLITLGKTDWTYGFMEIRAKLPCGVGSWPAIWMLGSNDDPYPLNGEIDIMEQVGMTPTTIYGTIHNQSTAGTNGNGGETTVNDACSVFHNYQLTWTPEKLVIAVDGKAYHTYVNDGKGKNSWPYYNPQYFLLNLAIGGDMAGPKIDDTIFPAKFEVEYIRVFQKK